MENKYSWLQKYLASIQYSDSSEYILQKDGEIQLDQAIICLVLKDQQ